MIGSSLGLADKTKILIAVPLAFGVIFVSILFFSLEQAENESRQAEKAADILSEGSLITTSIIEAFQSLVQFRFSGMEEYKDAYLEDRDRIRSSLKRLDKLLVNTPKQYKRLQELEELSELSIGHLDEGKRLIEVGDLKAADEHAKELKHMIGLFELRIKRMITPYETQGAKASSAQKKFRQQVKGLLLIGILAQIGIAVWLATAFSRGTLTKLNILMDNISRLKSGQNLNPTMDGRDELSTMDETFHMMASSITESTEKLKLSEARIRAVIEGLPIGVLVLNDKKEIASLNPAAEALFGYQDGEMSETSISKILIEDKKKSTAGGASNDSSSDIIEASIDQVKELQGRRKDGKTIPLELSARRFSGPEGDGFLLGLLDISDRHQIEEIKREFTAMITHDLRSPLSAIKMSTQLMKERYKDEISKEWMTALDMQERNCDRLLGLINDLLDLERLESGAMNLELEPIMVDQIFERAIDALEGLANSKKIELVKDPSEIELVVDPERIVQVLINLISNSIKFSEADTQIRLYSTLKDKYVEISVQDQGRGIPEDKLSGVFERFKQVSKDDATKKGGSGLGLAICKSIVEAHHGQIGVESKPGNGSRFWLTLPVYSDDLDDPDLD